MNERRHVTRPIRTQGTVATDLTLIRILVRIHRDLRDRSRHHQPYLRLRLDRFQQPRAWIAAVPRRW
jgi:hypothetical protein